MLSYFGFVLVTVWLIGLIVVEGDELLIVNVVSGFEEKNWKFKRFEKN